MWKYIAPMVTIVGEFCSLLIFCLVIVHYSSRTSSVSDISFRLLMWQVETHRICVYY